MATTLVRPYVSGNSPGSFQGDGWGSGGSGLPRRALVRERTGSLRNASPKARIANRTRPMKAPAAASHSPAGFIVSVRVDTFSIPGGNRHFIMKMAMLAGPRRSPWIRGLEIVLENCRRPPAELARIIGPDPSAPVAEATGLAGQQIK